MKSQKKRKKKKEAFILHFYSSKRELYWRAKIAFLCWRVILIYRSEEPAVCLINLYAKEEFSLEFY
jgi:hypothetical protein